MFNYAGWRKTCNFIFTVFAAVFIITRLVILPFWFVLNTIFYFTFWMTFSYLCVSCWVQVWIISMNLVHLRGWVFLELDRDRTLCAAGPTGLLWLDSLSFFQDHSHDVGVPPEPLPTLLWVLLLQWVDVCAAGSADLLGWAHLANGCQIPARQCIKHHF